MGEILISVCLGLWLITASILGYKKLKSELSLYLEEKR